MKLLIISNAPFIYKADRAYAYTPYINEMEVWQKYADKIAFCCPVWKHENGLLITEIPFRVDRHFKLIDFNLNSISNRLKFLFLIPYTIAVLLKAMFWADHIHLRCPGNVGLLGSCLQVFFPRKIKTAKYAGNWDPNSTQPWSYRLQKKILGNTFLTRKMQVLVYGKWEAMTKNIRPFFTASYSEVEKLPLLDADLNGPIHFIFAGMLVEGKHPLYAAQLVGNLFLKGYKVDLVLYGEGPGRNNLKEYISRNNLEEVIRLEGNQSQQTLKSAYRNSHFIILPSESEGWPKVIAEGMFWGCVPIATGVSCVSYMLDYGKRGILLEMDLEMDLVAVETVLQNETDFKNKRKLASEWSGYYTLDLFEKEIRQLLQE